MLAVEFRRRAAQSETAGAIPLPRRGESAGGDHPESQRQIEDWCLRGMKACEGAVPAATLTVFCNACEVSFVVVPKGMRVPFDPDTQGGVVGQDGGRPGEVAALIGDDQYISIESQADWIITAGGKGRPGDRHQGAILFDTRIPRQCHCPHSPQITSFDLDSRSLRNRNQTVRGSIRCIARLRLRLRKESQQAA